MNEDKKVSRKPWDGRFVEATEKMLEGFSASVHYDCRLYRQDIAGSKVHARMLARQGIISDKDADAIDNGLSQIEEEIASGDFVWNNELEDIHMNIEQALVEHIGEAGKRLHTARSRNDQVATDTRLYLREEIDRLNRLLSLLQKALLQQARAYKDLILPGYTHLQRAQPVLWPHHMLAYFEMFTRDRDRLRDCRKRVNICPLGSAALAGTGFPIDREYVAEQLGFHGITANSLDAVSDRDFIIEFLATASIIMAHLSRLSEELIIWTSAEFSFVDLPDGFCTGSSIMPQKKNPDVPELVRGKTGRVYGHLMSLLTVVKGLPLAYNRDLQEDKEALFDTVDTLCGSVEIMAALVARLVPKKKNIHRTVTQGFLTATDLADYLVKKGMPFRQAHSVVGKAVLQCISQGKDLTEMSLEDLKAFSSLIDEDIFEVLSIEGSVGTRRCPGGTAPERVTEALARAEKKMTYE
ncbi:MAG: argininosuccinate lyase [delta proteobacterium ML8_D]|jgi:argininosuccinate lyase|nr:MAG: argininosuccinate lyase [delta proteobacterium ML8_D]